MTWDDMNKKYPEYREEMTRERELAFVEDCFTCYEGEGFAKNFWSQGSDYKEYIGKPFTVIGRVPEHDDQHKEGNFMKKVTGYISVRALGCYDFEFYVDDNATEDEIKQKVDDVAEMSMDYHVEEGYIAEQQTVYRKKQPWEDRK